VPAKALPYKFGSRRGSELVEGMLMIVPLLALLFLLIDTSYGLFIKATLEYAVQAGANCAATNCSQSPGAAVQQQSLGLVQAADVIVSYCDSDGSCSGSNQPADAVVVVSTSYSFSPLAPLFRSGASIALSASATSVLTANGI
jgi:Flp pilus assembly protein TadG